MRLGPDLPGSLGSSALDWQTVRPAFLCSVTVVREMKLEDIAWYIVGNHLGHPILGREPPLHAESCRPLPRILNNQWDHSMPISYNVTVHWSSRTRDKQGQDPTWHPVHVRHMPLIPQLSSYIFLFGGHNLQRSGLIPCFVLRDHC